jgi:hypothetical protein
MASANPNQPFGQEPGVPPPGQPTQQFGVPPAKKPRKKLPIILAGVGVLALLCCGGVAINAMGDDDEEPAATQTNAAEPATKAGENAKPAEKSQAGLNDPVRDGKFEFTVSKIDCGKTKVGGAYMNEQAQGMFCLINLTVKNIGKEAQLFSGSEQKTYDASGTEYSNDTGAEIVANEKTATFLQEINPGNQVKGVLVYDVPKGTKLTEMELHDSSFSDGVRVKLA